MQFYRKGKYNLKYQWNTSSPFGLRHIVVISKEKPCPAVDSVDDNNTSEMDK